MKSFKHNELFELVQAIGIQHQHLKKKISETKLRKSDPEVIEYYQKRLDALVEAWDKVMDLYEISAGIKTHLRDIENQKIILN